MKKLLYLLLTVLMVLPATAYGQMSQAPTISYEENQDQLTIIVHGPGLLNVQVLRDHDHDWNFDIVLDEAQVEDHYEFTILRSYDDSFEGIVIATAKEDDHPTSETVTSQFVMRPYFIMPLPEITFTDEDNGVTCTVTNICPTFEITADINGEPYLYDSYHGGDVYSFFVEQTYEEQDIFVNAENKGVSHGDIGRGATASYYLPARELPVAEMPEITVTEGDEYYTISAQSYVEGAIVHLLLDGEEVENPYSIWRIDVEQTFVVMAYVEAPDMLPSEWVQYTILVPALPITATPVITVETNNNNVIVSATCEDEDAIVYLYDGYGEEVENPYTIERSDYDQVFVFTAYAEAPGKQQSPWVEKQVDIPALPVADPPEFTMVEDGDIYTITAYSEEEGAIVHLFLFSSGEELSNPYIIERSYEYQLVEFTAYAEVPDKQNSEFRNFVVGIEPFPPVIEQTETPTISHEIILRPDGTNYAHVVITATEPSDIYCLCDYTDNFGNTIPIVNVCRYNTMEFDVTDYGHYRVEAYAMAMGKEPSLTIVKEFELYEQPIGILYDFEEDGIYYKITPNDKVSVCTGHISGSSYYGNVSIPATVTHDGETYMVTAIDDRAFQNCAELESVSIGAYVTSIGNDAFMDCKSLTSVTLGDYVISLGSGAFDRCTSLTTVKMGSGLARIGENAFNGCGELTDIYCKAATPPVMASNNCFETDTYGTATLHVYPAVLDSYRGNDYWNQFNNIVGEDNVAPAAGDVNGDGTMSVGDVTTLIHLLLSGE